MGNPKITNTPYDDVFRTLLNDCSPLIIPLINAMFGEHYSGDEKIIFSPNEHFLNQQGGNENERITDSSFKIQGKETKKYHLECQSSSTAACWSDSLNMIPKSPLMKVKSEGTPLR